MFFCCAAGRIEQARFAKVATIRWILRIIALIVMLSGAGLPAGLGLLIGAATFDYFGAILRIMLVALMTMMNVLVYQHDTIISQAIAYLVIFKEEPGEAGG